MYMLYYVLIDSIVVVERSESLEYLEKQREAFERRGWLNGTMIIEEEAE